MTTVAPRGGYQGRNDRGTSGGYQGRNDRGTSGGYQGRNDRGTSGGYQGRDDRGGYRGGAPADADRPLSFEEAEAQRAEADTWTHYSSHAGEAKEVTEDNGFAALGVPERLVERLARDGITEPFPIQAATIPDALAGSRRPRPRPHRLGQDPGLRPGDDHPARRRHPPGEQAPALAHPRADPRARHAGERRARAVRARHRPAPQAGRRRPVLRAADQGAQQGHRHPRRHPGPARRPDGPRRGRARRRADRRARRGRPHGRHGLPARGHRDPRRGPRGRPAAALLGDPRQGHRHPGRPLPRRPGARTRPTRPRPRSRR